MLFVVDYDQQENFSRRKAAKRRVDEGIGHREPGWWKRAPKDSLNMVSEPRTDCVLSDA